MTTLKFDLRLLVLNHFLDFCLCWCFSLVIITVYCISLSFIISDTSGFSYKWTADTFELQLLEAWVSVAPTDEHWFCWAFNVNLMICASCNFCCLFYVSALLGGSSILYFKWMSPSIISDKLVQVCWACFLLQDALEGRKPMTPFRSFDNTTWRETAHAPARSKSVLSAFFVKQKGPKRKTDDTWGTLLKEALWISNKPYYTAWIFAWTLTPSLVIALLLLLIL